MSSARHKLVDSLAVLLTAALVLSTLDRSYDSRSYLLVGLVPVALLLGLAWWASRRPQGGPWLYVIGALLAYPPLGALVALQDPGPFLVPPWSSTGEVLAGTFTGPSQLVSTLPPVRGEGVLMVVPYAIGFLTGGLAAWLALGTRRAVAPALAVLVGLAAVIPVSVQTPSLALSRGALLAVLTLVWVSWRAHREEQVGRGTGGRVLAGAVVVGLVAGVVALAVPDLQRDERRLLRAQGLPTSGLNSISDPSTPAQGRTTEPLLLVDGLPRGRSLRLAALDTYAPTGWTIAARSPGTEDRSGTFQRIGPTITPLGRGPRVEQVRVRVQRAYTSDWLPTAGELTALRFDSTNGRTRLSEVRYNQFTRSALVPGGVTAGDDYVFSAVLTGRRLLGQDSAFPIADEQRQPAGAFLDVYLRPYARMADPMVGLRRFMSHLRDEGYVRFQGASSQTAAGLARYFLAARPMAGSPYQYSALVALAASRLGVPARVAVGATPDRRGQVFLGDVRSWVEVRTADGVWRTVPARRYVGRAGVVTRTDRIEAGPPVRPSRPAERPARDKEDRDRSPDSEQAEDAGTDTSDIVRAVVRGALVGLALLVVLAVAGVPVAKVVRRRRRRGRQGDIRASFVGGWQQVVDVARDRGTPVPEHLGRVAQARLLGHGLSLARAADVAVFAPVPPPAEEAEAFWGEVDELCRSLLSEVSRGRRLRAWLTPASLVTSWTRRRQASPEPERVTAAAARR